MIVDCAELSNKVTTIKIFPAKSETQITEGAFNNPELIKKRSVRYINNITLDSGFTLITKEGFEDYKTIGKLLGKNVILRDAALVTFKLLGKYAMSIQTDTIFDDPAQTIGAIISIRHYKKKRKTDYIYLVTANEIYIISGTYIQHGYMIYQYSSRLSRRKFQDKVRQIAEILFGI